MSCGPLVLSVSATTTNYNSVGQVLSFTYTLRNQGCKKLKGTLRIRNSLTQDICRECFRICACGTQVITGLYTVTELDTSLPGQLMRVSAVIDGSHESEFSSVVQLTLTNTTFTGMTGGTGIMGPTGATGPALGRSYGEAFFEAGVDLGTMGNVALIDATVGGVVSVSGNAFVVGADGAGVYDISALLNSRVSGVAVMITQGSSTESFTLPVASTIVLLRALSETAQVSLAVVTPSESNNGTIWTTYSDGVTSTSYAGFLNLHRIAEYPLD